MGVQRQLKVLGIFARLCHRDGKTGYLQDMPLVMRYLRGACGAIATWRRCSCCSTRSKTAPPAGAPRDAPR